MKILVINGPNLNMLGRREPEIYGSATYEELCGLVQAAASGVGASVEIFQTNHEGELVDKVQTAVADAIVINAGGLTHTSVSIRDALAARGLPTVEVHLTNIFAREEFRRVSLLSGVCAAVVAGLGLDGYAAAIKFLAGKVKL